MHSQLIKYKEFTNKTPFIFIILTLISIIVFNGTLNHQFISYDDYIYIDSISTHSSSFFSLVQWSFSVIVNANWHPVTLISLGIDYIIFGKNPSGFHFSNLLLHTINACLVYTIFNSLLKSRTAGFIIAVIFLLHPINVESLAWVSERKGLLAALFLLLAIHTYLSFLHHNKLSQYALSVVFFLLSLMSKAVFVTAPFLFFIIGLFVFHNSIDKKKLFQIATHQAPYFTIAFIMGLITIYAQSQSEALMINDSVGLTQRASKSFSTIPIYLKNYILPANLYIPNLYRASTLLELILGISIFIFFFATAIKLRNKFPGLYLGWAWFIILLFPVSGILQSGHHMTADRYTYVPMIGLTLVLTAGAIKAVNYFNISKTVSLIGAFFLILTLSFSSRIQLAYWENSLTLFHHTIDQDNNNFIANTVLAERYAYLLDTVTALNFYQKAKKSNPHYLFLYDSVSHTFIYNKNYNTAKIIIRDALSIMNEMHSTGDLYRKKRIEDRDNLITKGYLFLDDSEKKQLLNIMFNIIKNEPENVDILYMYSYANYYLKNYTVSEKYLNAVIKIKPDHLNSYLLLIRVYKKRNKDKLAEILKNNALSLFPDKSKEIINQYNLN